MYSSSKDTFFNFSIEKSVCAPCWNNSRAKPTVTTTLLFTEDWKTEEQNAQPVPTSHTCCCSISGALTQVKMEKKQKVMAARAASPPSFSGLSSGLDICHWFARKQKPTNHMKDQNAGGGEGRDSVRADVH